MLFQSAVFILLVYGMSMDENRTDSEALVREKYAGDESAKGVTEDIARLRSGEPLAYVIGNIPFLGLTISLDSHPLIPRPETEWWTEELTKHIGNRTVSLLDLCAGSGAIGLAVLKHCPNARVSFGELAPEHAQTIQKNIELNGLDASRADIRIGNLFTPFAHERYDFIATNPPYIPETRTLDTSVTAHEPREALFAGTDGLDIIRSIAQEAPAHLTETGELWMECDISNIATAQELALQTFPEVNIRTDQYGRERVIVAHLYAWRTP
jgi:release factor glutamine methyltransferase